MARKRSPETFEKRKRAFEKQRKRADKLAERIARNAAKKDGSAGGDDNVVELGPDGQPIEPPEAEGRQQDPDREEEEH